MEKIEQMSSTSVKTLKVNELTSLETVNKVIMFGFNYPHNFICGVWGNDTMLSNHFKSKFSAIYNRVGSDAVFNTFYCQLSDDNRELLINWIMLNYKG
jgi:hypothetical protein